MTKEEIEQFLADCWVEINGGGVITDDQIAAMEKIEKTIDEERIKQYNKSAYYNVKNDATFMCLPTDTWVDPQ